MALPSGSVVDAEILVVLDDVTQFDALQHRIHPAASRVTMLSEQTPARLVAFDLLALEGEDLREQPFGERRARLVMLLEQLDDPWRLTPSTEDANEARRWFDEFEAAGCDGLVAKRLDQRYVEGKREMLKIKHRRSVDAVVGGYRVHKEATGSAHCCSASTTGPASSTSSATPRASRTSSGSRCSSSSRSSPRATASARRRAARAPRAAGPTTATAPGSPCSRPS